jgi:alkylmercury lyase-like protein
VSVQPGRLSLDPSPAAFDTAARTQIYQHIFDTGRIPSLPELAGALGQPEIETRASMQRLADAHMLVLAPDSDEIIMANPFSAVASPFAVTVEGRVSYANCIWDALGIPAMLGREGTISTSCGCCGFPLQVSVGGGTAKANSPEAVAHFALPAARWWNDIITT